MDYQLRETVESAYLMGAEGLRALGFDRSATEEEIRVWMRKDCLQRRREI